MALFVVRVWLPDRPGALGAVASRIGAVHADVVGIEILERDGGRVVDELTIELVDATLSDLLVTEISQVDGVDVEHIRRAHHSISDRAAESLEVAAGLAGAVSRGEVIEALVAAMPHLFEVDWAAVLHDSEPRVVATAGGGEVPSGEWLQSFVIGTGSGDGAYAAVDELARVPLAAMGLQLIVSRAYVPLREGERQVMASLAIIADRRGIELVEATTI